MRNNLGNIFVIENTFETNNFGSSYLVNNTKTHPVMTVSNKVSYANAQGL